MFDDLYIGSGEEYLPISHVDPEVMEEFLLSLGEDNGNNTVYT